jgi:hypothetical protein
VTVGNPELAQLLRGRIGKELSFGGYVFRGAADTRECERAFRFRHDIFTREGFIDPSDFPDGSFHDPFDAVSAHFLVYAGGADLVGTTRFVLPSPLGFPTEQLFDFERPALARNRLGEFGRLAIAAEHRGGRRLPMLGLLKMVNECMLEHEITHVYAFMAPKLVQSYAALGCVSRPLDVRPPSQQTLLRRLPMRGYFARQPVQPVLFSHEEMMRAIGVYEVPSGDGSGEGPQA